MPIIWARDGVIWLRNGIAGDDTHGHVDDLARFVNADTVVIAVGAGSRRRRTTSRCARTWRFCAELPLRVVKLPMPAPLVFNGRRLPASYANFYIANGTVLVPTFNDPNDRVALNTLATLFPGPGGDRD